MMTPMANFIGRKVEAIKGKPTPNCPQAGDDLVAPFAATCLAAAQIGGMRPVKLGNAARAVEITVVMAAHDSTVPRSLLSDPEKKNLDADNASLMLGPATGYIVKFTNGLTVYLSGDTGLHADMKSLDSEFHKANLMLLNLGYSAITAQAGAYAANELVRPASRDRVARERGRDHRRQGAARHRTPRRSSRMVKGRPVYPALSGKTMEFDGDGKCVAGCS